MTQGQLFEAQFPTDTLAIAKKNLMANIEEGVECPCCGQFSKIYKRTITSSMAYGLILLSKTSESVHVPTYLNNMNAPMAVKSTGDFAKLRYWGLIEGEDWVRSDDSKRNGWYRITENGILFVRGDITVRKYARIYNNNLLDLEGDYISIKDAIGNSFNYRDLMEGNL